MTRLAKRIGVAALGALMTAPVAHADTAVTVVDDDSVFVIDAPDLYKVRSGDIGTMFSAALGRDVISNRGIPLGSVSDLFLTRTGEPYAVIDIHDIPELRAMNLGPEDAVVVPLRELRVQPDDWTNN